METIFTIAVCLLALGIAELRYRVNKLEKQSGPWICDGEDQLEDD